MKYWINTVSRNHVLIGLNGGFTQADHGKNSRLKNLAKGAKSLYQKLSSINRVRWVMDAPG